MSENKNLINQETLNAGETRSVHNPFDFTSTGLSPTGEMVSTIFATTGLASQAANMYLELQRLLQQGSIELNKLGYKTKKSQAEEQKHAGHWEGAGLMTGGAITLGMLAAGGIYQWRQATSRETLNAKAFEEAAIGKRGNGGVRDTEMDDFSLRDHPKVQERISQLKAGINFKEQNPSDKMIKANGEKISDERVIRLASKADKEAIHKQAKGKLKELNKALSDKLQLWNNLTNATSQILGPGLMKWFSSNHQYSATKQGAQADYLGSFGQQLSSYASQDGQQVQMWLELASSVLQTMGTMDDANNTR